MTFAEDVFPPLATCRKETSTVTKREMQERRRLAYVAGSRMPPSIDRKRFKRPSEGALERTPVSLLVSTDFVVASPVRDNLLLTIVMQQLRHAAAGGHRSSEEALASSYDDNNSGTGRVFTGFFMARSPFKKFVLGTDATRVATEPNAGGASTVSESLSVEYFARRFGASNVVTEMEVCVPFGQSQIDDGISQMSVCWQVAYNNAHWKKVDYICDIYGQRVGVSVTRAMSYPDPGKFTEESARTLLYKKLYGLVVARSGVSSRHSFMKAVLHVWCETKQAALLLQSAYPAMAKDLEVEEDLILVLTVAEGLSARPIFYESCMKDTSMACAIGTQGAERHPWWWLTVKPPKV
eukprot:jgi/Mesen1/10881/ME000935S10222